jgi:hypothetical protein
MLTLPIKKKWFDKILSGEKKEEYREYNEYYASRFKHLFQMYHDSCIPVGADKQQLILRNGYSGKSPSCMITATLDISTGKPEWGAENGKIYYILRIHEVKVI